MEGLGLQDPDVQKVLGIAEGIMQSKRTLDTEHLLNVTQNELNLPRRRLMDILHYLVGNHILVEGTRFTRENVLENDYRREIFRLIKQYVAVHFSFIKKQVFSGDASQAGSSGQLLWHLGLLLRFKYVKRVKVGNFTIFMEHDMDEDVGLLSFLALDSITWKILGHFAERGSVIRPDLANEIEENRDNVSYRLKTLIEHGIISQDPGDEKLLLLNMKFKNAVRRALNGGRK